jgi:hypothetical protein
VDWDKHLPSILAWGGSLLTGVFTLLGVWLANRSSQKQLTLKLDHEAEKENRERLRIRLEELYSLIGRWAIEVGAHHLTYRKVMEGDLTYNQALDIMIKNESPIDANRMFTPAELYFPSAHGSLGELKKLRDQMAGIQTKFKLAYKQDGSPSQAHAEAITVLLHKFDGAIKSRVFDELILFGREVDRAPIVRPQVELAALDHEPAQL